LLTSPIGEGFCGKVSGNFSSRYGKTPESDRLCTYNGNGGIPQVAAPGSYGASLLLP